MGFALFAIGYVIFYWGLHHPPFKQDRYSLWALFGIGTIFPQTVLTSQVQSPQPVQFNV